jgi:tetratricopeptide (TPR) repeat protein
VLVGLAAAGAIGNAATASLWKRIHARQPALNLRAVEGGLGNGLTLAVLGGFRAIIADFVWLANSAAWEKRDLVRSLNLIRLTTAIDPRPLYFWINGSRMIAYDMPVWRAEAETSNAMAPSPARQQTFDHTQAKIALDYLEAGLKHHPANPLLLLEIGNVHLRRLDDTARAAEYYRDAALRPGAPHYAGRIYAELLKQLGRNKEALDWLKELHPTLDPKDPTEMADLVLHRIRSLEAQLGIPPGDRYRVSGHSER